MTSAAQAKADWRLPYRTMDGSGSPTAAGVVGWNWIGELAQKERAEDAALLVIESTPIEGGGQVTRLYRSTTLLAVATTFRDDMNFTVLVRWKRPSNEDRMREALKHARGAIASLDEGALGFHEPLHEEDVVWPLRDELLHRIDAALGSGGE